MDLVEEFTSLFPSIQRSSIVVHNVDISRVHVHAYASNMPANAQTFGNQ